MTPRRASQRFRERAELLDFLLEVSRVTSETLDLAEQPFRHRLHRQRSGSLRCLRHSFCTTIGPRRSPFGTPSDIVKKL